MGRLVLLGAGLLILLAAGAVRGEAGRVQASA